MTQSQIQQIIDEISELRRFVDVKFDSLRRELMEREGNCQTRVFTRLEDLDRWRAAHDGRQEAIKEHRGASDKGLVKFMESHFKVIIILVAALLVALVGADKAISILKALGPP